MFGIKRKIKTAVGRIPVHRRYCPLCGKYSLCFMSFGHKSEVFHEIQIIGGGFRHDCTCPHCRSRDRFRWSWYVLFNYTDMFQKKCSVLHIAPEPQIANKIRRVYQDIDYITGDLNKHYTDMAVDVTAMPFPDQRFDFMILNHVLEHVPDEEKAMEEIKRVLKPHGKLCLSVPISPDRKTFGDPNVTSEQERLRLYGQTDHCRVYGTDAKEHFESFGFRLTQYTPEECAAPEVIEKWGLIPNDIVFVCEKM